MKRSIFALLVLIGALVISIASPLIYNHYVNETQSLTGDANSTSTVEDAVEKVLNPTFSTVDEAMQIYEIEIHDYKVDSLFRTIPPDVVKTISTVLIGRHGQTTKQDIVNEFKVNYATTYQYIRVVEAKPDTTNSQNEDVIKLPPSNETDTIINGQHFKIIKEIKNNDQKS